MFSFFSAEMKQQLNTIVEHKDHEIVSFKGKKGQQLRVAVRVGSDVHKAGKQDSKLQGQPSLALNGKIYPLEWGYRGDVFLPIETKDNKLTASHAGGFVYLYAVEVVDGK